MAYSIDEGTRLTHRFFIHLDSLRTATFWCVRSG